MQCLNIFSNQWWLPVILFLFCAASCSSKQPAPPRIRVAVATANDFSPSFEYVSEAEQANIKIASLLQPLDSLWVGAITDNSLKKVEPLVFLARKARTPNELNAFIEARKMLANKIHTWFDSVRATRHPKSDVFSAIRTAVAELKLSSAEKRVLLVFSDMNDNITRKCELDLEGIDVCLLYVYPGGRSVSAYDAYAKRIKECISSGHPLSLEVKFPVQAQSFDVSAFISLLRSGAK